MQSNMFLKFSILVSVGSWVLKKSFSFVIVESLLNKKDKTTLPGVVNLVVSVKRFLAAVFE